MQFRGITKMTSYFLKEKEYRKLVAWIGILVIMCSLVLVTSCGKASLTSKDCAEEYVKSFFHFNLNNRYTTMVEEREKWAEGLGISGSDTEGGAVMAMPDDLYQEISSAYWDKLSELMTDECLKMNQQNRVPMKYEEYLISKGLTVQDVNVDIDHKEEGKDYYIAKITCKQGDETVQLEARGRIDTIVMEDTYKVSAIVINGITDDAGALIGE